MFNDEISSTHPCQPFHDENNNGHRPSTKPPRVPAHGSAERQDCSESHRWHTSVDRTTGQLGGSGTGTGTGTRASMGMGKYKNGWDVIDSYLYNPLHLGNDQFVSPNRESCLCLCRPLSSISQLPIGQMPSPRRRDQAYV